MSQTLLSPDEIKEFVEASVPEWIYKAHVIVRDDDENPDNYLIQIFVDFQETEWVKIDPDGTIDVSERVRVDWEFDKSDADEVFLESIAGTFFNQVEIDVADLALTPATDTRAKDPLLAILKDGARLLPRDLVRRLVRLSPMNFARNIAEYSSFRQEDWYKEYEEAVAAETKEAEPGLDNPLEEVMDPS